MMQEHVLNRKMSKHMREENIMTVQNLAIQRLSDRTHMELLFVEVAYVLIR